jgi:hypothetical protein
MDKGPEVSGTTSKVGSKDNEKHKPHGGERKVRAELC